MARPYLCPNCRNWYTPVPHGPDIVCYQCADGTHAVNPKTGKFDCHAFDSSATASERKLAEAALAVESSIRAIQQAGANIDRATTPDRVLALVKEAETAFAVVETVQRGLAEALRWAGVFELPGRKDARPEDRWKGIDVLRTMVRENRRPKEDLDRMERSIAVCADMEREIMEQVAEARSGVTALRMKAGNWRTLVAPEDADRARDDYTGVITHPAPIRTAEQELAAERKRTANRERARAQRAKAKAQRAERQAGKQTVAA